MRKVSPDHTSSMPEGMVLYVLFGSEWINLSRHSADLLVPLLLFLIVLGTGLHFLRIKKGNTRVNLLKDQSAREQMTQAAQMQIQTHVCEYIRWELHENIGQMLSLIKLKLASASREDVAESRQLLASSISEIRLLSKSVTSDYASEKSVTKFVQTQLEMVKRMSHAKVTLLENTQFHLENIQTRVVLFWIIQECLQNIRKHTTATEVAVNFLERDGSKLLEIIDNSAGFDVNAEFSSSGIEEIRHRAAMIGAKVTWESHPGQGTKVVILL